MTSGPEYILDTNVVIGFLTGAEAARRLVSSSGAELSKFAVSVITRIELLSFPSLAEEEERRIEELLAALSIIPLDERIEAAAITLRRRARLKLPDAVIAASAQVYGLELVTLDTRLQRALEESVAIRRPPT